ncbi:MAG: hypothetical protein LBL93_01785 [Ruminococcus sp.]|jgi:hypothetical protein|nr:hypothetical protein [Ruminococcus sp.]
MNSWDKFEASGSVSDYLGYTYDMLKNNPEMFKERFGEIKRSDYQDYGYSPYGEGFF